MVRKLGMLVLLLTLVITLGATSCAKAEAPELEWITVGVNVPLSGGGAAYGIPTLHAAEMYADEINTAGGLTIGGQTYMLRVFSIDNKFSSSGGALFAEKLIEEQGGRYIVGGVGSAPGLGALEITEPAKVLTLSGTASLATTGPQYPLTFNTMVGRIEALPVLYDLLREQHPKAKNIAFLAPDDETGWSMVKDQCIPTTTALGWDVVAEEYFERGSTDFYAILTKILSKNPDVLDLTLATTVGEGALIMKQAHELGFTGGKICNGAYPEQWVSIAGKDAMEGTLVTVTGWDLLGPFATPKLKEVCTKYNTLYPEDLHYNGSTAYFAFDVIVKAMRKADSIDTMAVRDAMLQMGEFESMYGTAHIGGNTIYGSDCQFFYPMVVSQFQNGQSVGINIGMPREVELEK